MFIGNKIVVNASVIILALSCSVLAQKSIELTFDEVQNIVSQKLVIVQSKNDLMALQGARDAVRGKVATNAVVCLKYGSEESFRLNLQILEVAERMRDKTLDPKKQSEAGVYGSVPWPADEKRAKSLKGAPLWTPGQNPEDYKDSNPDLYALYNPLYVENRENTKRLRNHLHMKKIQEDLLRDIREIYRKASLNNEAQHYDDIIDNTIRCRQLRNQIITK